MIVADFSMNNGRENRNNGNQEKGKEEKEALRRSVRSQMRGTLKASPKFLRGRLCADSPVFRPLSNDHQQQHQQQSSVRHLPTARILFRIRNPLFLGWAQPTERAEITVKPSLALEVPRRDATCPGAHPFSSFFQLKPRTPGKNRNVAFEIMKH